MSPPTLQFERAEYDARLKKTRLAMERAGIDLLIVSDPSNMAWLTGYDGWSFYVHQCVLLPLTGEPLWYGRGIDANGSLAVLFRVRLVAALLDELAELADRHLVRPQAERPGDPHPMPCPFAPDAFKGPPVISLFGLLKQRCDFLRGRAHHKLARRDEDQLHADGVGLLRRHAEMLRPGRLMLFGFLLVERCDGGRGSPGGQLPFPIRADQRARLGVIGSFRTSAGGSSCRRARYRGRRCRRTGWRNSLTWLARQN